MAVGDVYEVTDVQSLFGQQVLNVYFYEQRNAFLPLTGTVAQALAQGWSTQIIPDLIPVQTTDLMHIETRVRNLFDAVDQGIYVTGDVGFQSGADTAPAFTSYGFQLKLDNASVRPGAKRIGGINEANFADGIPSAPVLGDLAAIADALAAPITGGIFIIEDVMYPIVVQRVRTGVPGAYEYRLPESSGELVFGTVIEALVKLLVTTQNSRKIGIGV